LRASAPVSTGTYYCRTVVNLVLSRLYFMSRATQRAQIRQFHTFQGFHGTLSTQEPSHNRYRQLKCLTSTRLSLRFCGRWLPLLLLLHERWVSAFHIPRDSSKINPCWCRRCSQPLFTGACHHHYPLYLFLSTIKPFRATTANTVGRI
jgi:hypothetical protein